MKLLIFDLDGTIIDSSHDLLDAVNYALTANNLPMVSYDFLKIHIGEPLHVVFNLAHKEFGIESCDRMIQNLIDAFIFYSKDHLTDKSSCFDGLIEFLQKRNDCIKVIGTTKPSFTAAKIARMMKFDKYFDGIFGSEDIPPKPDPAIIYKALERCKISSDDAVMIGDTDKDILAGKAAGIKTCLVLYGFGDKDKALSHKPDYIISHPRELETLIY